MDTLRGVVERITYHNEENGYTVAKLAPEGRQGAFGLPEREVTIVGAMLGINVGESVELTGRWTIHSDYGKQFVVEQLRPVLPATVAGMEKYLGSGLIRGVGPVTAKRIVGYFGVETLNVIETKPQRLIEVPGVGQKRADTIINAWAEQRAIKEVMLFLQSHGVTTSLATKIYKQYGNEAIAIVRTDPYRLARDIFGIGFLTADKIAQSLGLPHDAPERVTAGVAYALNAGSEDGHVYLPTGELVKLTAELLAVDPSQVALGIARLWSDAQIKIAPSPGAQALDPMYTAPQHDSPRLIAEQGHLYAAVTVDQAQMMLQQEQAIYLTPLYYSETGVANRLQRLLKDGRSRLDIFQDATGDEWARLLATAEAAAGISLAPQQQQAVKQSLVHRLTILTGGPGTGKTTTVRTILQLCDAARLRVILAAPTGRAAKRLSETTHREARTVHRLLEFKPGEGFTFQRNEDNPLEGDLLIVDEASMLDIVLTNNLLKAVPPGMHVLFVGDADQLPSVGPGNVLRDMIEASDGAKGAAPIGKGAAVVRLETIFRQAAGSYIIENAHRINHGELPIIDNKTANDFFIFKSEDPEQAARLCVELVMERIPRRFGLAQDDIQVLSPMHRGAAGVSALNTALQAALNPPANGRPEKSIGNRVFRLGDRVMQIRNNYDKDVYNGDMGRITEMDLEMHRIAVTFDGRPIEYAFLEMDELVHAYAISVHKSQGSEFPAVVMPMLTSHYMMLQRNLLYTGVTRARQLVVLVGQQKAISLAVRNGSVANRYTGLAERIIGST